MISREELLRSPEYWLEGAQNQLYDQVVRYMEKEQITQTELAARLGVTKGYVSQILRGNFNYTLKKLIELGLAIGVVPMIQFKPVAGIVSADSRSKTSAPKNNRTTPDGGRSLRQRTGKRKRIRA